MDAFLNRYGGKLVKKGCSPRIWCVEAKNTNDTIKFYRDNLTEIGAKRIHNKLWKSGYWSTVNSYVLGKG